MNRERLKRIFFAPASLFLALFAVPLFIFGCDSKEGSTPSPQTTTVEELKPLSPAPDFELHDLNSHTVTLSQFKGKVVLLNFWATWCVPCVMEMPALERLNQILAPEGFVVLAVNMDSRENSRKVEEFVRSYALTFPIALDPNLSSTKLYNVTGFPESFIIGRDGKIRSIRDPLKNGESVRIISDRPWDSEPYIQAIREILQSGTPE